MEPFVLDERLQRDSIPLARVNNIHILLFNNTLVPWFVLVPQVHVKELHDLSENNRAELNELQDRIASFVTQRYDQVTKINIGAIGNIVSQMHIHVIGRWQGDYAWPGVVWGNPQREPYSDEAADKVKTELMAFL